MAEYPEHEKLSSQKEAHEAVQRFLDFLEDQGWNVCEFKSFTNTSMRGNEYEMEPEWSPVMKAKASIVAMFFEIDEREFENEKRAMLEGIRAQHEEAS